MEDAHSFLKSLPRSYRHRTKLSAFPAVGSYNLLLQDVSATALVSSGAYALVSTFDYLTKRDIIDQRFLALLLHSIVNFFYVIISDNKLSRKLVHILSGFLFLASWPIYRELLKGPLYYVLVVIASALVFCRELPVGVIAVAMMCAGDGIADIVGRRFGSLKLPYNQQKSFAGSISMSAFGFLVSVGMLYYFAAFGYINLDWGWTIERVALIALLATLVESLPASLVDDNISVPLASMITALLTFRDM